MAKMESMSIVEESVFNFLKTSFHISPKNIKPELLKLLEKLKTQQRNRFETRAFVYLDIISWIESKLEDVPVEKIIREKFLAQQKK